MEPYRIFFPLGIIASILGTAGWIAYGLGLQILYPGLYHPDLMMGGFLFAFSAGFLMTAVPQFTGAIHCQKWECASGGLLFLALMGVGFLENRSFFHGISLVSFLALIGYCARWVSISNTL